MPKHTVDRCHKWCTTQCTGWTTYSCKNMHVVNDMNYQSSGFVVSLEEMDADCKLRLGNTGMSNSSVCCCSHPVPQMTTAHSVHCLPFLSCIIGTLHGYITAILYHSFTAVTWCCGIHSAESLAFEYVSWVKRKREKQNLSTEFSTQYGWINIYLLSPVTKYCALCVGKMVVILQEYNICTTLRLCIPCLQNRTPLNRE